MKKVKLIGGICLVLVLVVALLGFAPALAGDETDEKCTMAVIGKNGTADGSIMVWHNEELSPNTAQRLLIVPREYHEPGETKQCGYETIPQVAVTYRYIGDRYWPGGYPPGDWCTGINEFGVIIVSNAENSKEPPLPPETGISFCDMSETALERATTAEEGIEIMGWLIDTYGVAGAWPNQNWVMADQNEVWYMEQSTRHWVARKIGDNEILPISNRYNIGTEFDLASEDVVDYAVAQGWYDPASGEPFSWMDVYGVPATQNSPRLLNREARIVELLTPKWGSITVRDCFEAMRDHYEGTELYYYPSHATPGGIKPICSGSNVFGVVYHMRSWLPTEIGALMWYRMAAACSSVSVPIYAGTTEFPEVYTMLLDNEYDAVSAWWHFKALMNNVDEDYAALNSHVRDAWYKFEERELKQTKILEKGALRAYQSGDIDRMNKILTGYTNKMLLEAYNKANALNNWVLAQ